MVLAAFVMSTLLMTFPVAFFLGSAIPMDHQIKEWYPGDGDPWHYLWGFWYFRRAFETFPPHPFWTDLVFYPLGLEIPFLTGVGAILAPAGVLAPLIGLTLTYNVLWLLSFVLAGYTMYLLARDLFQDRLVAFFCGHLFMFSSYRMAHAREHLPLLMASFLVPLFVMSLSKAAVHPTLKRCVLPALVLSLSAGISWYCTIALSVFLAVFVLVVVSERSWGLTWRHARAVVVAFLVLVVTASPFVLPLAISPIAESVLTRGLSESIEYSADLLAFFIPSPTNPVFGRLTDAVYGHFMGNPYEQTVYLGYVMLGLSLWGVLRASREKTRLFVVAAATFFVLALGPFLHVDGQYRFLMEGEPFSVPLPYLLLRYVPFVSGMRVPSRFAELLVCALIVLAGYGLSALCSRVTRPLWKFALVGALCLASAIELASMPFPVVSAEVSPIYSEIGRVRDSFTVLELPLDWHIVKYHYYQTIHGKRLLVGHPVRSREKYSVYPAGLPLVPFLKDPKLLLDQGMPEDARRNAARLVTFFDIRYVIIHQRYLDPRAFEALDRFIGAYFPHGDRWTDGDIVVYPVGRIDASAVAWPEEYVIDFGAPDRPFALLSGWSFDERSGDTTFQWSSDRESSMYLYLEAITDRVLEMRLQPLTVERWPRQTVAVYVNGRLLDRVPLERGWQRYELKVPASALRAGLNAVTFTYDYTVEPARVIPGSRDPRKLAVAFDSVTLRRAGSR